MRSSNTYAIGLGAQRPINGDCSHCGFFFTGALDCGFFGAAGGIFGMLGGTGGWGGTGALPGDPGRPLNPPPGNL